MKWKDANGHHESLPELWVQRVSMTRPKSDQFLLAAKAAAREAVWLATARHEQGAKRNVLLMASRRGGSTWAMEIIAANKGVRSLNQPFSTLSPSTSLTQFFALPRMHMSAITSLDKTGEEAMSNAMRSIFAGELVMVAPVRFWERGYTWRSDRLVLKITDAKPVIEWFARNVDADIVYFSRHPIPQSLSCMRNGWNRTTPAFLRDPDFVAAYLDGDPGWCHDIEAGGSELDRWVLNWGLENVAPVRGLPHHPDWLHLKYEDCVREPQAALELLAAHLDLTDMDKMMATLKKPSGSSALSTPAVRQEIRSGGLDVVASGWRRDVDADAEHSAAEVLDRLHIDMGEFG